MTIEELNTITETNKAWYIDLKTEGDIIKYEVGTGASATAIPAKIAQKLKLKLSPSSADVRSAGNYALKVKGVSKVKLVLEDKVVEEWVYVIKKPQKTFVR